MPLSNNTNLARLLLWNEKLAGDLPIYEFGGKTITRQQLQQDVLKKAAGLRRWVNPGEHILLCLNDSPSLVSLFLAAIAIGAVPAVVNPRCRDVTLQDLLQHNQTKLLFVQPERVKKICVEGRSQVFSDATADHTSFAGFGLEVTEDEILSLDNFYSANADERCYLQYTSGSTGTPKAVIHTINTTLGFCKVVVDHCAQVLPGVRSYSVARMFFGYGMGNSLFFPLYAGWHALLHAEWPSTELVLDVLADFKPALFFAVPALYSQLKSHSAVLKNITFAVSAGAPLPDTEYQFWRSQGLLLRDGLGATEMGHIFLAQPHSLDSYSCAGLPLPGYQCELRAPQGDVLDGSHQEGVLYVRGPSMSPGYAGNVAATIERFTGGWYNTGDRFARDENGFYHFRGRADDLFKVKGRWVTPQAVEQRFLAQFSDVTEAALVASHPHTDEYHPTLFIVSGKFSLAERDTMQRWLRESCEAPMVPRCIAQVQALPRNDNGKLSRRDLQQQAYALLQKELDEALV
ncbi:AMP-binding protein [Cellvibrio sp. OA-2007]|uniref:AMP-binding protein n=1 Tax=Cellvibrio sp. OA-2007 TaxID=529823 RepID=UPI000782A3CE|nr:AMP-binding protein [Cellvibrio sp. OA-2007]